MFKRANDKLAQFYGSIYKTIKMCLYITYARKTYFSPISCYIGHPAYNTLFAPMQFSTSVGNI